MKGSADQLASAAEDLVAGCDTLIQGFERGPDHPMGRGTVRGIDMYKLVDLVADVRRLLPKKLTDAEIMAQLGPAACCTKYSRETGYCGGCAQPPPRCTCRKVDVAG